MILDLVLFAAVVRPIHVDARTVATRVLPALAFSLLLVPLAYTGRRVSRAEGPVLLAADGGFLAWILQQRARRPRSETPARRACKATS